MQIFLLQIQTSGSGVQILTLSHTHIHTHIHTQTHTHTRTQAHAQGFIVEKHQILCYAKKRLSFFHDSPNTQLRFCQFITAVYHSCVNMSYIA